MSDLIERIENVQRNMIEQEETKSLPPWWAGYSILLNDVKAGIEALEKEKAYYCDACKICESALELERRKSDRYKAALERIERGPPKGCVMSKAPEFIARAALEEQQ